MEENIQEDIIDDEDLIEEESDLPFLDNEYDEINEYDDDFSTGDFVIVNLINTWTKQQEADRTLKSQYGKWIMFLLLAEIVFIGAILVAIGLGYLSFDEWVINAFILTVFGQIIGIVYIIVKNLFSDGNEIIDILKKYIK